MARRGARARVVADTNVVVSAFAFGGVPELALRRAFETADLFVSPSLLEEYRDTVAHLRAGGKITADQAQALLAGIAAWVARARVVQPRRHVAFSHDSSDDMVLDCCRTARASVLLTGDRDLLALAGSVGAMPGLHRLRILSPRAYLRTVGFFA